MSAELLCSNFSLITVTSERAINTGAEQIHKTILQFQQIAVNHWISSHSHKKCIPQLAWNNQQQLILTFNLTITGLSKYRVSQNWRAYFKLLKLSQFLVYRPEILTRTSRDIYILVAKVSSMHYLKKLSKLLYSFFCLRPPKVGKKLNVAQNGPMVLIKGCFQG